MYHQHFGLNRSPFSIEPDPDFLWLGEKHQEGLSALRYGILENKGFLLLTGDIGTGKTVLIRSLLTGLTSDVTVATIQDPSLTVLDFFNILSYELGMAAAIDGKADFFIQFKKFVRRFHGPRKSLLVIIDEAQRLTNELLDEIRVLSNIDYDNRKLVNIFFVGQIEFSQTLSDPCNIALRQRISVSYHLAPLNHEETGAYIKHRLKVAGTEEELFMPEAVHEIFNFSNGTPRLINILCDRALITGYSRDLNRVSPEMIRECARELDISSDAEATDIRSTPQIEKPPAIEETADQAKAVAKPFRIRRKWIAASVISAVAFLLFGVFFTRLPEHNRPQESASTERQNFKIRPASKADPKDSSPSTTTRVSDGRKSQKPVDSQSGKSPELGPEKVKKQNGAFEKPVTVTPAQVPEPLEKSPSQELFSKLPPEQPTAAGQSAAAAEEKIASSGEWPSMSIESKQRRFLFFFKPSSADLEDSSYEILRHVSDFLSANPNSEVTLTAHLTQDDRPGLSTKLLGLRANSIKSVLAAQTKFKGKITVIDSYVRGAVEDPELAGGRSSKPWAEIRIEPRAKGQGINFQHAP
jgi:general secretion pathway protein A